MELQEWRFLHRKWFNGHLPLKSLLAHGSHRDGFSPVWKSLWSFKTGFLINICHNVCNVCVGSKCFHVQLQVVSTKYILAHSSHAEGLSPVCNYHVDLQTLPLRELFCITSTYVSTHSSVSFNLYAVSSKKRINTFIITISSSCVPSFNFLSTTLSSSTTLLTSFSTSWYTTPSIYNPWHALEAHFHFL